MSSELFVALMRRAIVGLPQTLKAALRVAEDQDLPEEARVLVAGAIIHWLSRTNSIPGVRGGAAAYVDDVIVLLLALERLMALAPDQVSRMKNDLPDLFDTLDDDLAACRSYFGPGIRVLEQALARVVKLKHMGRTPAQCIRDESAATMLYEEVSSALIDFDIESDAVARELKDLEPLVEDMRKKAS